MKLKNRFTELLAAHQRKTGRKWTYEQISEATGVSTSTLSSYAQNKVRRFDAATVEPLMEFFGCDVADFFILEADSDEGQQVAVALAG